MDAADWRSEIGVVPTCVRAGGGAVDSGEGVGGAVAEQSGCVRAGGSSQRQLFSGAERCFLPNNHGWPSWAKSLIAVGSNHTGHI